jgi:hypothetical protein
MANIHINKNSPPIVIIYKKLKWQVETISYLSECLKLKRLSMLSIEEIEIFIH